MDTHAHTHAQRNDEEGEKVNDYTAGKREEQKVNKRPKAYLVVR